MIQEEVPKVVHNVEMSRVGQHSTRYIARGDLKQMQRKPRGVIWIPLGKGSR